MLFYVLARKTYVSNLQYRGAHMIKNAASLIFGFMYVAIWAGIGSSSELGAKAAVGMTAYIAFNQAVLWITGFLPAGLGIEQSVRTGQIALDVMRPTHLFTQKLSQAWGQVAYQFVYKFLPIYILYYFMFSLSLPNQVSTYLWTTLALVMAAYISICIQYMIGLISMWTTESRWLYWVNYALSMLISGFFIPIEWLPAWLRTISLASPYPSMLYYPTNLYLGRIAPSVLFISLLWCIGFTFFCLLMTRFLQRKLEVQGG
ncbi:ABC-2 family transporter protein [Paenibacillus sp. N1-5-1-14]|uniref:ABC transporter permease n=1 Tax=Paenibacillus radicibacter TaxID=2972488 RepID=UPI002158A70F|nr:ABC-2 family transporter protein [Paenibacillus radicibacter]MCR8642484.1 ABC-2 family transporter protein [Paenibacillus radicibacter]